ncbi:hypothetical protein V6N13_133336 [Hibiscus sabdariffa]|uniref:Uncharacterized protein n=1 Tax=Hibiscus sabdariffa TaxID=183260 RepID=A0ABR2CIH1_9ROSI
MESVRSDLFKRHSDYRIFIDEIGLTLDFLWEPYVMNLTNSIMGFKAKRSYPDVMVMGAGLWHLLHLTNASDYDFALRVLKSSVVSLLGANGPLPVKSPHLFWLGMPMLINGKLRKHRRYYA